MDDRLFLSWIVVQTQYHTLDHYGSANDRSPLMQNEQYGGDDAAGDRNSRREQRFLSPCHPNAYQILRCLNRGACFEPQHRMTREFSFNRLD
jgi:hypothetical protein